MPAGINAKGKTMNNRKQKAVMTILAMLLCLSLGIGLTYAFFTDVVKLLYTIDTNTNVFPSLHVGYSLAMMSIWVKEKTVSLYVKLFISLFCISVCLSTAFVKQHSVLDGFASIIMCAIIEVILFKDYYLNLFKKKKV